MHLVLAIIQDADAAALLRALRAQAFDVTKLASTGGFLREGNTTLMLGVSPDRLGTLRQLVQDTCHARTRLVMPGTAMTDQPDAPGAEPLNVPVGGAVLFVLTVDEFVKY